MQTADSLSLSQLEMEAIAPKLLRIGEVLFCDFDGPIADVSDRYYNTYQTALAATQAAYAAQGIHLPVRRLTKAQFWRMKQNRVPDTTIADWSGLSDEETVYFLKQVEALVNQPTLLHQDKLQPGAQTALVALNALGVKIAIVTLRQVSQVKDFLEHHDLATTIHQIYGVDDTVAAYSNRVEHKVVRLREAIADQNRMGQSAAASWMIGDTEADICAGQAAGLSTIALTCGIRSAAYLKGFNPTHMHRDLYAAAEFLTVQQAKLPQMQQSAVCIGAVS